jgi:hypothetical protein
MESIKYKGGHNIVKRLYLSFMIACFAILSTSLIEAQNSDKD